jgi:hypothetical protein
LSSFLQPPLISSLLGSNILLSTLFSNTLSLCSFLNIRDQVLHPYRTIGKIIVLYILIFTFLDSRREDKRFGINASKHYPNCLLLIFSWIKFWSVTVVPKYLNCATFSNDLLASFLSWYFLHFGDETATFCHV